MTNYFNPFWAVISDTVNNLKNHGVQEADLLASLSTYLAVKALTVSHDEIESEKLFSLLIKNQQEALKQWRAETPKFKKLIRVLEFSSTTHEATH